MPRYYDPVSEARGRVRTSGLEASSLFTLYTPERQVDTWLSHAGFLGHFVLEVLLRVASQNPYESCHRHVASVGRRHCREHYLPGIRKGDCSS